MRGDLIAWTVLGTALASSTALADITLYGKIYAEVASEEFGDGPTAEQYTTLDDAQNLGRLGVKFDQELRGGLKVFGKYEFSLNAPDSSNDFKMRDAHVGIRGRRFSLAMGRFDGAYKVTGGNAWDPFALTSLGLSNNGGQSGTLFGNAGFIDHAVQAELDYREGEVRVGALLQYAADGSPAAVTAPKDSFIGGLTAGYGDIDLIYATSHNALTGRTNTKVGAKAVAGEFTFIGQSEDVEMGGYDPGGAGQFLTGIVTYAMGNWLWAIEFGDYTTEHVDDLGTPSTTDDLTDWNATFTTFGGRYYLAKNAWVVFGHRSTDSQVDALDRKATVLGLRYDF